MNQIKKGRFILFAYDKYESKGGMGDYITSFNTSVDLREYFELDNNLKDFSYDFVEVFDTVDFKHSCVECSPLNSSEGYIKMIDEVCVIVDCCLGISKKNQKKNI